MDECFVLFRYPSSGNDCQFISCSANELSLLSSYKDVGKHEGFVFAPFELSGGLPIVIFPKTRCRGVQMDEVDALPINNSCLADACGASLRPSAEGKIAYHESFVKYQSAFRDGDVKKAVLSRAEYVAVHEGVDLAHTYIAACEQNPNSFVALVYSPLTGMWLIATPEVLVEKTALGKWHTIALAGTQANDGRSDSMLRNVHEIWDEKNIEEQEYVASYIGNRLIPYAKELEEKRPYTVQAANLLHIRSDFYFDVQSSIHNPIGEIVAALHPTPAICGFPQESSLLLINEAELCDRQYYSGFCGMIENGEMFRLYVTLRCVRIFFDYLALYAGGGILPESEEDKEWTETEMKMETIKRCIH